MIKSVPSYLCDFGQPGVTLIDVASGGLRGFDLGQLTKRAGEEFAEKIRRFQVPEGMKLAHELIVGATEWFSANKNGDGFNEATCRARHPTFVKHAYAYRGHKNKFGKDPHYGKVLMSHYNEDMHRIETVKGLYVTKEAAERGGGRVADRELEYLHKNGSFPVSMACTLPWDVCVGCGNKARTRDEYCTGTDQGGHCKRGGVRDRMSRVCDDGFLLHVENPNCTFFDSSMIEGQQADRIAHAVSVVKEASADGIPHCMGGAELAQYLGISEPELFLASQAPDADLLKLACDLALCEDRFHPHHGGQVAFRTERLDIPSHLAPQDVVASTAARGILLTPTEFVSLGRNYPPEVLQAKAAAVAARLPGVYGRIVGDVDMHARLNTYVDTVGGNVRPDLWAEDWASRVEKTAAHTFSNRMSWFMKMGASTPPSPRPAPPEFTGPDEAETGARAYALYKLAWLAYHKITPSVGSEGFIHSHFDPRHL